MHDTVSLSSSSWFFWRFWNQPARPPASQPATRWVVVVPIFLYCCCCFFFSLRIAFTREFVATIFVWRQSLNLLLQLTFLISVPREKESLNILKPFCTRRRLCFFDPFPDYCISDWPCFCADVLLRAFQVPLLTTSFFLKSCRERNLHFDFCFFLSLENPPSSSLSHRETKSRASHRPFFLNSVHYGLIEDHFLLQQQHQKKKKKKKRRRRKRFQCFSCSFVFLQKHQQSCFVHWLHWYLESGTKPLYAWRIFRLFSLLPAAVFWSPAAVADQDTEV